MLDEVWSDVHVLEGVVKVSIAEIRRALGETAARPRHLHTVQRRGYRFAGPVVEESTTADAYAAAPSAPTAVRDPRVEGAAAPQSATHVAAPPRHGDRRQLTLLSCALEDLTELGRALPAGEIATLLDVCDQAFAAVVRSLGGRLVRNLDEGLVACFGYPTSLEDDAGRAVRAALRLVERVPALNVRCRRALTSAGDKTLRARVGVFTGPVDVAAGVEPRDLVLGDALDRVRQLGAHAEPDTVVLEAATQQLVRGGFLLEALGEVELGSDHVGLYRALRSIGSESRLDVADANQLTPIVGREQELSLILDRWESAREGQGQSVLVSGDAGIGKSRLVHTLHERIRGEEHGWIELRASAFHRNSSFHPVIELLRHSFSLTQDDAPEEQIARIEAALEETELPIVESLALLANLMSLPLRSDLPLLQLSPEMHRKRTLEVMCAWLLALADRKPHVLIVEDLHWADPSTIEFLGLLIEQSQAAPLLIVITYRPFEPPWASQPNLAVLPLTALTQKQMGVMLADLVGGKRLPRSVREYIVSRADGVPLFVEELTKSVLESDLLEESDDGYERTDPLPGVPTTLQDSLEARLDRLGAAKELCQLAAALGREFPHALLEEVAGVDGSSLDAMLQALLDAGLLYRRGVPPRATYTFKHALIQETAYGSLLTATRRELHARIVHAFAERFPERLENEPETIARHYEEAGLFSQAIGALERAGRRATAASANLEAIAHLRHAIALVSQLPQGPERDQRETALQVAIGLPLVALRGSGTPEVEEAYARARSLSQNLGESEQLAEALDGLVTFYVTQSRLDDANELAEKQLAMADRLDEPRVRLGAHYSSALIRYFRGDSGGALEHFDRLAEVFDPVEHRELISVRGENIGAVSRVWRAWALWMRGYPDRAVEEGQQGIALAQQVGHAYSSAYALAWMAVVHMNRREEGRARELAEHSAKIGEEHGFPIPLNVAKLIQLRCARELDSDERIREGELALAALGATGTQVAVPQILGGFAEFCLECERPEAAPPYLDAAFAISSNTGQPHWDAELHRIRSALLLADASGFCSDAEDALRVAIDVARVQQTKSFELRAASQLAELLRETDRSDEGRALLGPIYGQFTEGFDTVDLQRAARLLAG